jgi:hypothetical protein
MKKITNALLALLLVFALCACAQSTQSAMSIKPSELSDETEEVLDLFDDEIEFFDVSFDGSVKSYAVSVWAYRDGEWTEAGTTVGNVEKLTGKIAVRMTETGCDVYFIDEDGHIKYSVPNLETSFDEATGIGGAEIDREIPIEPNREIPILVKIGTDGNTLKVPDITEDFRNAECSAGIAVTLTVYDKAVE